MFLVFKKIDISPPLIFWFNIILQL